MREQNKKVVVITKEGKGLEGVVSDLKRAGFKVTPTNFKEGKRMAEDLNPRAVVIHDNGNPGALQLVYALSLSLQPCRILVGGDGDELRRCNFMAVNKKAVYLRSGRGEFTAKEVVTRVKATLSDEDTVGVRPVEKVPA